MRQMKATNFMKSLLEYPCLSMSEASLLVEVLVPILFFINPSKIRKFLKHKRKHYVIYNYFKFILNKNPINSDFIKHMLLLLLIKII